MIIIWSQGLYGSLQGYLVSCYISEQISAFGEAVAGLLPGYFPYLIPMEPRPEIVFLDKPGHVAFEPKTDIKFEDDNPEVRYR